MTVAVRKIVALEGEEVVMVMKALVVMMMLGWKQLW
jgi:hypothetical protein